MKTWKELLKSGELIGRDLEIREGIFVYRGPISSAQIEKGRIVLSLKWTAALKREEDGWELCTLKCFQIPLYIGLIEQRHELQFFLPNSKSCNILYHKGKHLEPAKVRNLVVS